MTTHFRKKSPTATGPLCILHFFSTPEKELVPERYKIWVHKAYWTFCKRSKFMPTTPSLGMSHVFPHAEMELLPSCTKFASFVSLQDRHITVKAECTAFQFWWYYLRGKIKFSGFSRPVPHLYISSCKCPERRQTTKNELSPKVFNLGMPRKCEVQCAKARLVLLSALHKAHPKALDNEQCRTKPSSPTRQPVCNLQLTLHCCLGYIQHKTLI